MRNTNSKAILGGLNMFESQHQWFNHELQFHRKQWACLLCADCPTISRADLECHYKDNHDETSGNIEDLLDKSRLERIDASCCPLCTEYGAKYQRINQSRKCDVSIKQFQRHLGSHMEQLALAALPPDETAEDDEQEDVEQEDYEAYVSSTTSHGTSNQSATPLPFIPTVWETDRHTDDKPWDREQHVQESDGQTEKRYSRRRPTFEEILSNTAPPPWTLSAFMAYLSQNHCLETLEFTMDASRYTKHYREMAEKGPSTSPTLQTSESEYMRMLWTKLLDAYIAPNGPREVNLPSNVRDHLLSLPCTDTPPDPKALEPAVEIIYELMDESVLAPFLNSIQPMLPTEEGYDDVQSLTRLNQP